ncbi:MAG TPA: TraR/DksA C4-type zinc finger protein [Candidatus Paceibacterota bacterium]|nr:TraR/DksA C4-type zinc finger protein [Candidatus Paceibacterota bacterium]
MHGSDFLNRQRKRLHSRKASKLQILKDGGEQSLSHSEKDIIYIEYALRRIDENQYGLCSNCGTPIRRERLEAIPEALNCIECQSTTETKSGHA